MKRKILAMFLCVALTFAIFGTLAVGAEENVEQPAAAPTCTCGTEDETHAEDCALYEKDETKVEPPACTCGTEDDTHAEDCALYTAPETEQKEEIQEEPKDETKEEPKDETKEETKDESKDETKDEPKDETEEETKEEPKVEPKEETKDETKEEPKVEAPVCNCGAEDDDHKETCPCYVPPVCDCGAQDGNHAEDCPCYVAPELTMFEKLMATETKEAFDELVSQLEQPLELSCQEFDDLEAHYYYLCNGVEIDRSPIVYEESSSVNYTNVAPFDTGK